MPRPTKHVHKLVPLSYSLTPRTPNVLFGCTKKPCIYTEVACLLCKEDGNRRRHKSKHAPVKDRDLFNRSLLALTKVAMEYEKRWGKPKYGDNNAASDS